MHDAAVRETRRCSRTSCTSTPSPPPDSPAAVWGSIQARLALIPHGSYVSLYSQLGHPVAVSRAALGLGEARRVLLLFGRLGRYKGGAELLDAFAQHCRTRACGW